MDDDWKTGWQRMIDAIGTDFGGPSVEGADAIERSLIRRFVEPLEFDCPLHLDSDVARQHGFSDVVAPISSLIMFALPPLWSAGDPPLFASDDRDVEPDVPFLGSPETGLEPPTSGYFGTETYIEQHQPVSVGDRLSRVGRRLVACEPKKTSVGIGAFTTIEEEIRNQHGDLVATLRCVHFSYSPHPTIKDGTVPED